MSDRGMFDTDLGVSKDKLKGLHAFAIDYRQRQAADKEAEARQNEDLKKGLLDLRNSLAKLHNEMEKGKQTSTPLSDGTHLVIRKGDNGIRMAITHTPNQDLSGYRPQNESMVLFQEVTVGDTPGNQQEIDSVFLWDKEKLKNLPQDRQQGYWGSATEISLKDIENMTPAQIAETTQNSKNIISPPTPNGVS